MYRAICRPFFRSYPLHCHSKYSKSRLRTVTESVVDEQRETKYRSSWESQSWRTANFKSEKHIQKKNPSLLSIHLKIASRASWRVQLSNQSLVLLWGLGHTFGSWMILVDWDGGFQFSMGVPKSPWVSILEWSDLGWFGGTPIKPPWLRFHLHCPGILCWIYYINIISLLRMLALRTCCNLSCWN